MDTCTKCEAQLPPGARWCPLCHTNTVDPSLGTLASPGSRLIANVLDAVIPVLAAFMVFGTAAASEDTPALGMVAVVLFFGYIVWALVLFGRGQTPGKRLMSLRVVKEQGKSAGFGTMLFREWIGKWISGLIFSLGYLWILFDKDNQGWHDKLASTYVAKAVKVPVKATAGAVRA